MNANQVINMLLRMFARKAVNKGMHAGIKHVAGRGEKGQTQNPEQARSVRETQRKAQQGLNIARRFTKF